MKKLLSLTLTILVLCGMSSSAFAACRPCGDTTPTAAYGCQTKQYVITNGCWQTPTLPDCGSNNCWLPNSDQFWQKILEQINGVCNQDWNENNDCNNDCYNDCNGDQNCNNDQNCGDDQNCDQDQNNDAENNLNNDPEQDNNTNNTPNDDQQQDNNTNNTPNDDQQQDNNADNTPGTNQNQNNGSNNNQDSDQDQVVDQNYSYVQQVLSLVNQERSANGLDALTLDSTVSAAAQVRAEECATSFSHTRPNGSSCFTALKEMGVNYNGAAENIAYGQRTPQEVVNAWMNSDGHRKNILNGKYTEIGIGYAVINGTPYWSQFFVY